MKPTTPKTEPQPSTWFGKIAKRFLITVCAACGLLMLVGCATTSPQSSPRPAAKPEKARPQVVTLTSQPSWLLIGGKDVDGSKGGDVIRVSPRLSGIFDFDIMSYEPETNPVTITFFSGGRVVYWKGKGEITKVSTGERILVPIEK